jgi:hypothetical protein
MTTTLVLNLIAAIIIVGGLAAVCRVAYRVAGGLLDRPSEAELPAADERLAA